MDPARFTSETFGTVVKTPGKHGFYTFVPSTIPRALSLTTRTVSALSDADRALGRLAGAGRLLPNPHLLVSSYLRREAVASSRIEGTEATMSEVLDAEATGAIGSDVREVLNYIQAMERGLELIETLPLSRRLIEELHRVLLTGVRGAERSPGSVRKSPNWIGSADNTPATAVFVPPPAEEMERGLSDWERFVHERSEIPPLVRCALLHYQFETLHPFLDGNGRIGRLLITFFLMSEGHLPQPLLYLSGYFEDHREQYYDRLQAVREQGDLEGWLTFFLTAVSTQANDAVRRSERIIDMREAYLARLHGSRSRAREVVDLLLINPIATTRSVATRLDITLQGATNLMKQPASLDVVRPLPRVAGRSNRWIATGAARRHRGARPARGGLITP